MGKLVNKWEFNEKFSVRPIVEEVRLNHKLKHVSHIAGLV